MHEQIWAYCDACKGTRPVNGEEFREFLTEGKPGWRDLTCSICHWIIATISVGPEDGSMPEEEPHVPTRISGNDLAGELTAPATEESEDPVLRRVHSVHLQREGELVQANVGDMRGVGENLADALRDLAGVLDRSGITIWIPRAARSFSEDGQLKAACSESGHVTTFRGLENVIAYICEGCGSDIEVDDGGQ